MFGESERHRLSNFLPDLEAERLAAVLDAVEQSRRQMVVVKTHAPVTDAVRQALDDGRVQVQAICRDPRDIALSMRDAALRGEAWGKTARGTPITVPNDARRRIARQIERFRTWAALPDTLVLDYERTAFETVRTAKHIAIHMQIAPAPWRDTFIAKRRFTQFNTGRSLRHLTEMEWGEAGAWYDEFSEVIEDHGLDCPPRREWPARLMTWLARLSAGRV